MKRLTVILTTMLLSAASLWAVPAHPGKVKVQQPDGTTVTLRLLGDEWQHFHATTDGYSVVKDSRGYYMYAELKDGQLKATRQVAHDADGRSAAEQAFLSGVSKYLAPAMSEAKAAEKASEMARRSETLAARQASQGSGRRAALYDYNNFKGLIILVQYNDETFSRSDIGTVINDMVNKENYTGYSSSGYGKFTGSVRDYYSDNSGGKFQPQFDVVGPVQIDYSKYYAHGTDNVSTLVEAALTAADSKVDFKNYDGDNDGNVDMVYFIFAGIGSNYTGNDERLIWPCASYFSSFLQKDGMHFGRFALSTEAIGTEDLSVLDGIGTMCHEFSHVLGLPDFYDTDYEKSGGQSVHPGIWSVMAGGCYENYSRTPVGYSLYERYAVGFFDEPEVINAEGTYTLEALYKDGKGYRINSPVANEFFLFENRQKNAFKWDACLPGSGLLVHRVDRTNGTVWYMNKINNNPSRNYYQVVRAGGDDYAGESTKGKAYDLFPGALNVKALNNYTSPANLKTWSGKNTKWGLEGIKAKANGDIEFRVIDSYVLTSLSLPDTLSIAVGMKRALTLEMVPAEGDFTLTWESSDPTVATVDGEGLVVGVSEGQCTVSVQGGNGIKAECKVIVSEMEGASIREFTEQETNTEVLIGFNDAEVLYVYAKLAYVRDATGSMMVDLSSLEGMTLNRGDRINGKVIGLLTHVNKMPQFSAVEGLTDLTALTVTPGEEPQPREVKAEELSASDYSDYIEIKSVKLLSSSGCWAVDDNNKKLFKLHAKFGSSVASLPTGYSGKYYRMKGIYGTNKAASTVYNELYLTETPEEVEAAGIETVTTHGTPAGRAAVYNLQGQRVGVGSGLTVNGSGLTVDGARLPKGIYIVNGRKYVNK